MTQGKIAPYLVRKDVYFFVVGDQEDNELVLEEVLEGIVHSIDSIFRDSVDKRMLLENFELLVLVIDEVLDDGMIIETDKSTIVQRVKDSTTIGGERDAIVQVLRNVRKQVRIL